MESIDALAKAVNEFDGGLILVSHDMRLISQVAKEIWVSNCQQIVVISSLSESFISQSHSLNCLISDLR
jgi:ATP-binding cassette subfamily F protein 2